MPAALNITSTRQRLPAAVTLSSSSEMEARTAVTHLGLIERAAVVVPKLKADSSAADAGTNKLSLRPLAESSYMRTHHHTAVPGCECRDSLLTHVAH